MRLRVAGRCLTVGAALRLVAEGGAAAQTLSPPGPSERRGLFVSAGAGVSRTLPELKCFVNIDASDDVERGGGTILTLDGGWQFSRELGATLHVATSGPVVRGAVHTLTAVTLQYWPSARLWVKAGAGVGSAWDVTGSREGRHLAVVSAAGYELWRSRRPGRRGEGTLDAQVRVFATGGGPGVQTTSVSLSLAVALFQTGDVYTVETRR